VSASVDVFEIENNKPSEKGRLILKALNPGLLPSINFEEEKLITVNIQSIDSGSNTAESSVLIHVCDRNDPPVLADGELSIFENSFSGTPVGSPLMTIDEDFGQTMTYSIENGNYHDGMLGQSSGKSLDGWQDVILGQGFGKSHDGWHDVLDVLVLGKFQRNNHNCGVDEKSYIGNMESSIGKTWHPEANSKMGGKTWKKWKTASDGLINFQDLSAGGWSTNDYVVAYVATYIYSKTRQRVELGVCSDDGQVTWINGRKNKISNRLACRPCGNRRALDKNSIELSEGENVILLKVGERRGGWNARISFKPTTNLVASSSRLSLIETSVEQDSSVFAFSSEYNGQLLVAPCNSIEKCGLDFERQSVYKLFVRVTDDGFGLFSDVANIRVLIIDVNEKPVISGSDSMAVEENIIGPYNIGSVDANDEDTIDSLNKLKYTLIPSTEFEIINGNVRIKKGIMLNYETTNTYNILVVVTDSNGLISEQKCTVTVIDRNDNPVIKKQIRLVKENALKGDSIGMPIEVADEDQPLQEIRFRIMEQDSKNGFSIQEKNGQITVNNILLDWETKPTHLIRIGVVDCSGLAGDCTSAWDRSSESSTILIQLVDVNESPVIEDTTILQKEDTLPYGLVGPALTANDPDTRVEQKLSYNIVSGSGKNVFEIESCSGQLRVAAGQFLDYEGIRKYSLTVKVEDAGGLSDTCTVEILLEDVNERPRFVKSGDLYFTIDENPKAGSYVGKLPVAFDIDAPFQSASSANGEDCLPWKGVLSNADEFQYDLLDNFCRYVGDSKSWCLTSSGKKSLCSHQDVEYKISDGNFGGQFEINARTGELSVSSSAKTNINFEATSQHVLQIEVCDTMRSNGIDVNTDVFYWSNQIQQNAGFYSHKALCDMTTVAINVRNKNDRPIIRRSSLLTRYMREGSNSGTVVGDAMQAIDEDGDSISWWLLEDKDVFEFKKNTGELKVLLQNGAVINFEQTSKYYLKIIAGDRKLKSDPDILTTTVTIEVKILDVNEPPYLVSQQFKVLENATSGEIVGTEFEVVDPDVGQLHSFQIIGGNTQQAFAICNGDFLCVLKANSINYEDTKLNKFYLVVEVRDFAILGQVGSPSIVSSGSIIIDVLDVNEQPFFPESQEYEYSVYEDATIGATVANFDFAEDPDVNQSKALKYSIDYSASTTSNFAILNNGTVYVTESAIFDFERGSHKFFIVVAVSDTKGLQATQLVQLLLLDSNEAPILNETFRSIGENAQYGDLVGTPVIAEDEDLNGGQQVYFRMNDTTNGTFAISKEGQLYVTKGPSGSRINPYLSAADGFNKYEFSVCASDVGFGAPNFQPAIETCSWATISIFEENEPPIMTARSVSVPENSKSGSLVGQSVEGTDPDGDSLSYNIVGGNLAGQFYINNITAQISTIDSTGLDFERRSAYTLIVEAVDSGAGNLTTAVTINVFITDVNEAPSLKNLIVEVSENLDAGMPVGKISGDDEDAEDELSYFFIHTSSIKVTTSEDGYFLVDENTGDLKMGSKILNFELVNKLVYSIVAVDSKGLESNIATLTILVLDENDRPMLPRTWKLSVKENSPPEERIGNAIPSNEEDSSDMLKYDIAGDNCWTQEVSTRAFTPPFAIYRGDNKGSMTMSVDALDLAKIKLQSVQNEDRNSYEIRLGERSNTLSRLRRCNNEGSCTDCSVFPIPPEPQPLNFTIPAFSNVYETKATPDTEIKVLTIGDFGYDSLVGGKNCDDLNNCAATKWQGRMSGAFINIGMPDGLTFKINTINLKTDYINSKAFEYNLGSLSGCSSYATASLCNSQQVCEWDTESKVCIKNSCKNFEKSVCTSVYNCKVIQADKCVQRKATYMIDPSQSDISTTFSNGEQIRTVENQAETSGEVKLGFSVVKGHAEGVSYLESSNEGTVFLSEDWPTKIRKSNNNADTTNSFLKLYGKTWEVFEMFNVVTASGSRRNLCRPWRRADGSGRSRWYVKNTGELHQGADVYRGRNERSGWEGRTQRRHGTEWQWDHRGTGVWYKYGRAWENYIVKTRLRSSDNGWIGVIFRVVDHENYYIFETSREVGYSQLARVVNGYKHRLESNGNYNRDHNSWYSVEIHVVGDSIDVFFQKSGKNMNRILSVRDNYFPAGSVGIVCAANHGAHWGKISVTATNIDGGFKRVDGKSFFTTASSFTASTWINKDGKKDLNKHKADPSIFAPLLKLDRQSSEFYADLGQPDANIAARGNAYVDSISVRGSAARAIDGSKGGINSYTTVSQYWTLDMSAETAISKIKIWSVSSNNVANEIEVSIANIQSYNSPSRTICGLLKDVSSIAEVTCPKNSVGQYIFIRPLNNVILNLQEVEVYQPASAWGGGYSASWNDLNTGWNEVTLRYDEQLQQLTLFVNGVKISRNNVKFDDSMQINSLIGEKATTFNKKVGIITIYDYAKSDDDISEKYEELEKLYTTRSCGNLVLQYFEENEWKFMSAVTSDAVTEVVNAPLAAFWRLTGFEDRNGFCVIRRPEITGTKGMSQAELREAALLNPGSSVQFWMSWEKTSGNAGVIRYGRGDNPAREDSLLMSCEDRQMVDFKYISVSTAAGQHAEYRNLCYKGVIPRAFSAVSEPLVMPISTSGVFSIDKRTGQLLTLLPILDFETTPVFSVKIKVTDGRLSSISTVRIKVIDRNEPPKMLRTCSGDSSVEQCKMVLENAMPGTLVGTPLIASDQDAEMYNPSAQLSNRKCDNAVGVESLELIQTAPGLSEIPHDLSDFVNLNQDDDRILLDQRLRQGSGKRLPRSKFSIQVIPGDEGNKNMIDFLSDNKFDKSWTSSTTSDFHRVIFNFQDTTCLD
jgi:hypothetical protein